MPRPTIVIGERPDWAKLRHLRWLAVLIVVPFLLFTTYYTVPTESVGIVQRFGRFTSIEQPGLHFKLPLGVDEVTIVPVLRLLKLEFGFGTPEATNPDQASEEPMLEKSIVTGDTNQVLVEWVVQ